MRATTQLATHIAARAPVLVLLGAAATLGCGGGSGDGGTPPVAVAAVDLSPAAPDTLFSIGQTLILTATARDGAGTALPNATFTYLSQNQGVATVSTTGVVTAVAAGATGITAASGGRTSAPVPVRVRQKLVSLVLASPSNSVAVGGTLQMSATPEDAAEVPIPGLPAPAFASSNTAVASIDPSTGLLSALSVGQTTVSASLTSPADGPRSATRDISVTAAAAPLVLTGPGNAYNPPSITIAAGGAVTFNLGGEHNARFESGAISTVDFGGNANRSFPTAGTYRFRCEAHSTNFTSGMTGTVVVQ